MRGWLSIMMLAAVALGQDEEAASEVEEAVPYEYKE